jgi:hypothetical protein
MLYITALRQVVTSQFAIGFGREARLVVNVQNRILARMENERSELNLHTQFAYRRALAVVVLLVLAVEVRR